MFGCLIASFSNQLASDHFHSYAFDLPARLATFVLLFWLFLQIPSNLLRRVKWSWVAAAIFYAFIIYRETEGGKIRNGNINSQSIIYYSELVFLMGIFAVLSIGWNKATSALTKLVALLAGLCGLFAVYFLQTRGAWLAIPVFSFLIVSTQFHGRWNQPKLVFSVLMIGALLGFFSKTEIVQDRIEQGHQEITEFLNKKNQDTSVGVRLQLWEGSWEMFKEHPLFGIGKEQFPAELQNLSKRGIISSLSAIAPHSHNEILYSMATLGIVGLLGLLLTYIVPAVYFIRYIQIPDQQIRSTAAMGLSLVLGFFIFGLVDVIFFWKICTIFYSIALALFMALAEHRKKELMLK